MAGNIYADCTPPRMIAWRKDCSVHWRTDSSKKSPKISCHTRQLAHTSFAMNTEMKTKTAAGGPAKASKKYEVTNGKDSKIVNDPSNAKKMAKRLNAKAAPGAAAYIVKPYISAPAPSVETLQKAADKSSAAIAKGPAKPSTSSRAAILAVIVVKGKKLALMRKGSAVTYAIRANKPGAVAKLIRRATSPRPIGYGLTVENAAAAAKLEVAKA